MSDTRDEDGDEEEEIGPGDPDYDLSEAHGYRWEPRREHWPVPPWLLVVVSLLVVAALVLPTVLLIARAR
jgi:hypothetical protein